MPVRHTYEFSNEDERGFTLHELQVALASIIDAGADSHSYFMVRSGGSLISGTFTRPTMFRAGPIKKLNRNEEENGG